MRPGSPRRIGSAQRLQLLSLACEPAQAQAAHADDLQLQRDEALRSASLAAMTLMLSAQGLGLASCPMVGFDAQSLAAGFGLQAYELPVMLVALGHAAGTPRPQKARRPLADILAYA